MTEALRGGFVSRELADQEKQALPCFKQPGPWQDDNTAAMQKWAARQCVTRCAQRAWCDGERQAALTESGIATGVWAGRIWTHRESALTPKGDTRQ